MRKLKKEKAASFVEANKVAQNRFVISLPDERDDIVNGVSITVYARPKNTELVRFSVGTGKVLQKESNAIEVVVNNSRHKMDDRYAYYARIPRKKSRINRTLVQLGLVEDDE